MSDDQRHRRRDETFSAYVAGAAGPPAVRRTPAAAHPAELAVQRAGRLRRRRIATTAVICAAAVGLLVPAGIAMLPPWHEANVTTTKHATPTQTPSRPVVGAVRGSDGVLEPTIDFGRLPLGPAPAVPWYGGGAIHDGDRSIPFGDFARIRSLQVADGGYVALTESEGDLELFLISPSGQRNRLDRVPADGGQLYEPAVSTDGTRVAWSRVSGSGADYTTVLNVASAASGEVTDTRRVSGNAPSGLEVRAFLGTRVLLNLTADESDAPQVEVWDPSKDTLLPWYKADGLAGITSDGALVAFGTSDSQNEGCFDLLARPGKRWLWRSCEFNYNDVFFDTRNRYVAAPNFDVESRDNGRMLSTFGPDEELPDLGITTRLTVFAARTGEPILRINDQAPYQVAWESSDTFLFAARGGTKQDRQVALVRCTTAGRCELATEPQSSKVSPYTVAIRR
jgi:hypothetical protein